MKLTITSKGILSIIGGIFIHLGCGAIYTFGLLNPFMISYLYTFDSKVTTDDGFFLMPLGILFFFCFVIVGALVESKAGPRL